jgi:hypothetical protein
MKDRRRHGTSVDVRVAGAFLETAQFRAFFQWFPGVGYFRLTRTKYGIAMTL